MSKNSQKKTILARLRAITLVLLAVAVITLSAMCVINKTEWREREEELRASPITVTVRGVPSQAGQTTAISSWNIDLFTGKNPVEIIDKSYESQETIPMSLAEYLKDVQIRMSQRFFRLNGAPVYRQEGQNYPDLIGITSISADERLLPESGCEITWYDGYDESVFDGDALVCLVPAGKAEAYDNGTGEAVPYFSRTEGRMENGAYVEVISKEYECALKIVGTYTAGDEVSIYCPFEIIEQVYAELEERPNPDSISATLADNLLIDEFIEKASFFYSNLSEESQNSSSGLRVKNRSSTYTFSADSNALDIIYTIEFDITAEREESERFFSENVKIIVALVIFAVLLLVIPMIFKRVMRGRTVRIPKPKELFGLIYKLLASFAKGCAVLIRHTWDRMKRAPVRAVALLLFASVVSTIICALQASNDEEMKHYEEAYQAIPIKLSITNLSFSGEALGTGSNLPVWIFDLFTEQNSVEIIDISAAGDIIEKNAILSNTEPTEISLKEYVKDLQVKMKTAIKTINGRKYSKGSGTTFLIGMTSISSDKQLLPEYGCEIKWYEGYDESVFTGGEAVCLIPESKATTDHYDNGSSGVDLYLSYSSTTKDGVTLHAAEYECTLKIVGTYTAGDELSIYCPFPIIEQVYEKLGKTQQIDSLSATIANNRRLEEFIEKANMFFMDPAQKDEEIPWGIVLYNRSNEYDHLNYRYAMDINDELLAELSAILEDSIKFNRTVTVFVVILSVISGFLIGFLMVRRRKRDIMLMRMVGESNARVYAGFALEQMICIVLGIAVGGAYYKWNPINNLAIFAVAYFVALSLALVIFMSKKLIKNVKEDE